MTVTVTTSVAGAVAGQVLIPIPIVGGVIGAVVGGMMGGYGTDAVFGKLQKYKVQRMMKTLEETQNHDGSWKMEVVLDTFDLKESFFTKYRP